MLSSMVRSGRWDRWCRRRATRLRVERGSMRGPASGGSDSASTASSVRSDRACTRASTPTDRHRGARRADSRLGLRRITRAQGLLKLREPVRGFAPEIFTKGLDLLGEILRAAGFLVGEDGNPQCHERDQKGELRHALGTLLLAAP